MSKYHVLLCTHREILYGCAAPRQKAARTRLLLLRAEYSQYTRKNEAREKERDNGHRHTPPMVRYRYILRCFMYQYRSLCALLSSFRCCLFQTRVFLCACVRRNVGLSSIKGNLVNKILYIIPQIAPSA